MGADCSSVWTGLSCESTRLLTKERWSIKTRVCAHECLSGRAGVCGGTRAHDWSVVQQVNRISTCL